MKSDTSTLKDKDEAWNQIADMYNNSSVISVKRNVAQLKKMWSNMKATHRNAMTKERQARFATGSGPEAELSSEVDPDIAEISPNLMTTAPVAFSSNISKDVFKERHEAVFEDDFILEEFLIQDKNEEASIADSSLLQGSSSCLEEALSMSSSDNPKKKSKADVVDFETICVTKKGSKATNLNSNYDETSLKMERIKRLMKYEEELANLKIEYEEAKQKLELKFLNEKYSLELRAAAVATELAEFELKKRKNEV